MAKTGGKAAAKVTSKAKKRSKKMYDDTQDPPIIVKGGALPFGPAETHSIDIEAEDPMNFSYRPNEKNPANYGYPSDVVSPISSIVVVKDGEIKFSLSVANSAWEIILQPGE